MNHPELLLAPVLMLFDYVFTIVGARASRGVYREHFVSPSYELNPAMRAEGAQVPWLNWRRIAMMAFIIVGLIVLDDLQADRPDSFRFMLGMLFGMYGASSGQLITNLFLFGYLNRHPNAVAGQVRYSQAFSVMISLFMYIGLLPLLAVAAAFATNGYTLGMLVGIILMSLAHFFWLAKADAQPPAATTEADMVIEAELIHAEITPSQERPM